MRIEALLNTKKREERKAVAQKITAAEGSNQELSFAVESAGHCVYCNNKSVNELKEYQYLHPLLGLYQRGR